VPRAGIVHWALVLGLPAKRGVVDAAIGRDPRNPLRFKVSTTEAAKPAVTHYVRLDSASDAGAEISWLACRLETGRTHQIRVHLEHIGHPLIGDPLYRRKLPPRGESAARWKDFDRQALHASRLSLDHPISRQRLTWFHRPAPDLEQLMRELGFGPLDVATEAFR
jgi:23S rRNA pseudouridine1911/1915/1917 synthase